jgi:hypothetical protein
MAQMQTVAMPLVEMVALQLAALQMEEMPPAETAASQ